jgi:hypothetical protein
MSNVSLTKGSIYMRILCLSLYSGIIVTRHTELQHTLKNVPHPVAFDKQPQLCLRNENPTILSL